MRAKRIANRKSSGPNTKFSKFVKGVGPEISSLRQSMSTLAERVSSDLMALDGRIQNISFTLEAIVEYLKESGLTVDKLIEHRDKRVVLWKESRSSHIAATITYPGAFCKNCLYVDNRGNFKNGKCPQCGGVDIYFKEKSNDTSNPAPESKSNEGDAAASASSPNSGEVSTDKSGV